MVKALVQEARLWLGCGPDEFWFVGGSGLRLVLTFSGTSLGILLEETGTKNRGLAPYKLTPCWAYCTRSTRKRDLAVVAFPLVPGDGFRYAY